MTAWHFEIPGEPHAQGRPRVRVFQRDGHAIPIVYDPAASRNWKAAAQDHMRQARGPEPPLVGPVRVHLVAYFTCPLGQYRERRPLPERWHTKRPDGDNVLKAFKDAAKGVLWLDDSQVAVATICKVIAAQGAAPRVVAAITSLPACVDQWLPRLVADSGRAESPAGPVAS